MIQAPMPPMPPTPNFDPNLFFMGDGPKMVLLVVLSALVAATLILRPIMRALAQRMGGKGGADPALRAEIELLHHRLAEMEPLQARLVELEERLDFAERLLAQAKAPERLPP
jgi:Tfp pilus assembly protein PilO